MNQKVAGRMLEKLGARVEVAVNGREAVRLAAANRYDLIFMDCQMPEMDGYAATRQIRAREDAAARIPIVAMTAELLQGARERCLDAGMDDYISKPIQLHDLAEAIERNR